MEGDFNPINGVEGDKEKRMDYMHKLVLAGSAFRLPEDPKKVTPQSWNGWLSGIRATIQEEDILRVEKLKYLWDPEPDALHPVQGIPKDIVELAYLLKIGRISRHDIEYNGQGNDDGHPSKTAWSNVQALTEFVVVKAETSQTITTEVVRKVVDKIVAFMTSDMYEPDSTTPGKSTIKYFEDHTTNRKALRKFRAMAEKLLPSDINDGFKDGFYVDYDAMIGAMKRKYSMGNEQKTIVDHFLKIDKILEKQTKTEFTMGALRSHVKKLLVTKEEDRPYIQYYKGHKERITRNEEFGPMVNFLLEYIYFNKKITRAKWRVVEKAYHHLLDGHPSYKKWHESSYELWHVIDKEIMTEYNNVQANVENENENESESLNAVKQNRNRNQNPSYPNPRMNMGKSSGSVPKRNQRSHKYNNSNNNNNNKARNDRLKNRLAKYKCRHCSRVAGSPKYHRPPFGGGNDSQCPYNQAGEKRPGFFFMAMIEGYQINELDLSDDEDDDILYENEVENVGNTDFANQPASDIYQFAS